MKNLIATLVIILVLILIIGGVVIFLGTVNSNPQKPPVIPEQTTVTPTETTTEPSSQMPTVTIPASTVEVTTETVTESETTEEVTETTQPANDEQVESGSFISDTGTSMDILVNWSIYKAADGTRTLHLDAYLKCFRMHLGSRYDGLVFKLGDERVSVDTAGIDRDEGPYDDILLGSVTMDLPDGGAQCVVSWDFKGNYDGETIDAVVAEAWIN